MPTPTIDHLKKALSTLAQMSEPSRSESVVGIMHTSGFLHDWIKIQGSEFETGLAQTKDILLLSGFWELCTECGLELTSEQQKQLFECHFPPPAPPQPPEEKPAPPRRRRLPDERQSLTHNFGVSGCMGRIIVGLYEDGSPGEISITLTNINSKQDETMAGLLEELATRVSISLQYGVPVRALFEKIKGRRYQPEGFSNNPEIPTARSISDYIFRWLELKFVPNEDDASSQPAQGGVKVLERNAGLITLQVPIGDALPCHKCSSVMVRSQDTGYKCIGCGATPDTP